MLRRLLTRCLGLIPSVIVAAALGRAGVSTLLVISQVVLSIMLPFIIFPLLWLCSSREVMRVKRTLTPRAIHQKNASQSSSTAGSLDAPGTWTDIDVSDPRRSLGSQATLPDVAGPDQNGGVRAVDVEAGEETVDYSLGIVSKVFGWLMWILIVLADGYAIVTLALGEDQ